MSTERQVITFKQAKQLKELGVSQQSVFIWRDFGQYRMLEVACNGTVLFEYGLRDTTNESEGETYAALLCGELVYALKGYTPYWVAIWGEWGYKDTSGQPRGYENFSTACVECLINLLENKKITAEEVNQRLAA